MISKTLAPIHSHPGKSDGIHLVFLNVTSVKRCQNLILFLNLASVKLWLSLHLFVTLTSVKTNTKWGRWILGWGFQPSTQNKHSAARSRSNAKPIDWLSSLYYIPMKREVYRVFYLCFRLEGSWKSGTLLNEVILWESAVHKRQNERVHNNVHLAEIQYVQFTFAQKINAFTNDRSLNVFRHNTGQIHIILGVLDMKKVKEPLIIATYVFQKTRI